MIFDAGAHFTNNRAAVTAARAKQGIGLHSVTLCEIAKFWSPGIKSEEQINRDTACQFLLPVYGLEREPQYRQILG